MLSCSTGTTRNCIPFLHFRHSGRLYSSFVTFYLLHFSCARSGSQICRWPLILHTTSQPQGPSIAATLPPVPQWPLCSLANRVETVKQILHHHEDVAKFLAGPGWHSTIMNCRSRWKKCHMWCRLEGHMTSRPSSHKIAVCLLYLHQVLSSFDLHSKSTRECLTGFFPWKDLTSLMIRFYGISLGYAITVVPKLRSVTRVPLPGM